MDFIKVNLSPVGIIEGMINRVRFLAMMLLPLFIIFVLLSTCFIFVKPNEFGIKQRNIGFDTGILHKE